MDDQNAVLFVSVQIAKLRATYTSLLPGSTAPIRIHQHVAKKSAEILETSFARPSPGLASVTAFNLAYNNCTHHRHQKEEPDLPDLRIYREARSHAGEAAQHRHAGAGPKMNESSETLIATEELSFDPARGLQSLLDAAVCLPELPEL